MPDVFRREDVTDIGVEQQDPSDPSMLISREVPVQVEVLKVEDVAVFTEMTGCPVLPGA
jgi:hypothetical protein